MAVFTIAGLTIKEAIRRKTLLGALLMGILVLGLSLLLLIIRARMEQTVASGDRSVFWYAQQYPRARSQITLLCLFAIRALGSLFAILLAGGAISGEIERGLLSVILPKPIPRWTILLGKWLGFNLILIGSVLFWTILLWASLTWQARGADLNHTPLLKAGLISTLYPIVIGTLTLSLSTFAQRLFGTSLALTLTAFSYLDGIFEGLARGFDTALLHKIANVASVVVPQGSIAWWVEDTVEDIAGFALGARRLREAAPTSPEFLRQWGEAHLHVAHLDRVYLVAYVAVVLMIGILVFQRRDV
jgi:Cu-processing system permease protein